jgi:single-stranded-DNA-specific exonuclease
MPDHSSFYLQQRKTAAPPVSELEERVVGVTFDNRQAIINRLQVGEQVVLRREPSNAHDHNAIRVENSRCEQIGYIRRELAETLAPALDQLGGVLWAQVVALPGGDQPGYARGVRIRFKNPGGVRLLPPAEEID